MAARKKRSVDLALTHPIFRPAIQSNALSQEDFMTKGASDARPLSPHLQIWRFTATMAASITHRGTGTVLYGGTLLLAFWALAASLSADAYAFAHGVLKSPVGFIIIAGYVWSLLFHLMNGLRHLYWDSGRGLAPKTATMTAWLVYGASLILAAIVLWAGYSA